MCSEERLQLTQHGNNHNKFYRMVELSANELTELGLSESSFRASWGRVGNKGQSKVFSMGLWDRKLRAKMAKGYVRLTDFMMIDDQAPASEEDATVDALLQHLQKASSKQVQSNYELANYGDVTRTQLDKVKELLKDFGDMISVQKSHFALTKQLALIWTILPRKIVGDLRKQKIVSYKQAREQLQVEQDTVDALAVQVVVAKSGGLPISEAMGMVFTPRDDLMRKVFLDYPFVVDHRGERRARVDAMWRVSHQASATVYESYKQQDSRFKEFLYFHGSANRNWMSIFDTGLRIRPAGVSTNGDMFGRGIYFADVPMKSLGYCGLAGVERWATGDENCVYVALFQVNVGNQFGLQRRDDENKLRVSVGDIGLYKLRPFGFDSVAVKSGYITEHGTDIFNNEFIVYEQERAMIAALARVRAI